MAKKLFQPLYFLGLVAEELIKAFETPDKLLTFLTENVNHMYSVQLFPEERERELMADRNRDRVYDAILVINNVVPAWYNNLQDPIEPMARGIQEVIGYHGAEGWADMVGRFAVALSRDVTQVSCSIKYTEVLLRQYTAFCLTLAHVKDYEAFQNREKKAA